MAVKTYSSEDDRLAQLYEETNKEVRKQISGSINDASYNKALRNQSDALEALKKHRDGRAF